jgi:hypothetical protein
VLLFCQGATAVKGEGKKKVASRYLLGNTQEIKNVIERQKQSGKFLEIGCICVFIYITALGWMLPYLPRGNRSWTKLIESWSVSVVMKAAASLPLSNTSVKKKVNR